MKGLNVLKRIVSIVLVGVILTLYVSAEDMVSLVGETVTTSSYITFDFDVVFWNSSGYDEYIVGNQKVLGVDLS